MRSGPGRPAAERVAVAPDGTRLAVGRTGGGTRSGGPAGTDTAVPPARRRTARPRPARWARGPTRGRTLLGTTLFVLGFSVVFATEGLAFGGLGLVLERHPAGVTQILGAVTIVLGLLFAGVFDRFPSPAGSSGPRCGPGPAWSARRCSGCCSR